MMRRDVLKLYEPWKLDPEELDALTEDFFEKRETNTKPYYRKPWLRKHPEDLELDAENMYARMRGFDNGGIRNLMAAICLTACSDYQRALQGKTYERATPPYIVKVECERHFDSEMMNFFTNRMDAEEIGDFIKKLPPKMSLSIFIKKMGM